MEPGADIRPKVTAAHLRRAESMCRLRLASEHHNRTGNRLGAARFEVEHRIFEDARLAHAELRRPVPADFPRPTDLLPEQQRVHAAAAAGYVRCFGDRPARTVEVDEWATEIPELDVRLVSRVGLALEGPAGRELRVPRVTEGGPGRRPTDDVDVAVAVLRTADWVGERPRWLRTADLLAGAVHDVPLDHDTAWPAAMAWLGERVATIRGLVADPRPRVGAGCAGCPYVAACPAHRGS